VLTTQALQAFIEQAYRVTEEQARTGEVLRFMGIKGAEIMLENLRAGESIGPRGFLLDALGQMPETYPIIVPLLTSDRWQDQRLGVEILGMQGRQEAVPLLAAKVNHSDERIRLAAIDALANFRDKLVVESLRLALGHASPRTRAEAGKALGRRRSAAIAMPLLAALASEKDQEVRRELLQVLAGIEAPEASAALVRVATQRRGLLGGGGRPTAERLEVVSALAISRTQAARQALTRIAVEADGPVKDAASRALEGTEGV
jgi:HEAT repeat protein